MALEDIILMMSVPCCLLAVAGVGTHIIPFVVKLTGDVGQEETSLGKDR